MVAYIKMLERQAAENEAARQAAQQRAAAEVAKDRLIPLELRLEKLIKTLTPEEVASGLSVLQLQRLLKGRQAGRHASTADIGTALRKLGYKRRRSWGRDETGTGFSSRWYDVSKTLFAQSCE